MLEPCKIMLRWPKTRRPRCGRLREARKWGGRRGEAKWVVVWGWRGERGVGAVKARAPAVTSLHRFTVRRHLATLRYGGWPPLCHPLAPPPPPPPVGVTPLEAEADILKNDSESHRGPHWRFLAGSTRPPGPPDIPLFFALGLSHSKSKGRKSGRATKRGRTIAAKDAEINERVARSRRSLRVLVIKP